MKKGAKIFVWVLILLTIGLIIYILVTSKKKQGSMPVIPDPLITPNPGTTDADNAGINTSIPPVTVGNATFSLNDEVYAGENTLNAYKTCSPSSSNIASTFNKGALIGKYLRKEGNCIVVSINTYYTYWFLGFHNILTGSNDRYLLFNANIYKK